MVDPDEILRRIQREENVVDTIFSYQRTVHSAVANSNMEAVSTLPLYGANSDVSFIFSACQHANVLTDEFFQVLEGSSDSESLEEVMKDPRIE